MVTPHIGSGKAFPLDSQALYVVLTSADISVSGFCTDFCGFHYYTSVDTATIKYAFVGNPDLCLSSCTAQRYALVGATNLTEMLLVVCLCSAYVRLHILWVSP